MRKRKSFITIGMLAAIAVTTGLTAPGVLARGEPEATITVGNNFLSPAKNTIQAGTNFEDPTQPPGPGWEWRPQG